MTSPNHTVPYALPAVAVLAAQDLAKLRFGQPSQFEALSELSARFTRVLAAPEGEGFTQNGEQALVFGAVRHGFQGAAQSTNGEVRSFITPYATDIARIAQGHTRLPEERLKELHVFCAEFARGAGKLANATPA